MPITVIDTSTDQGVFDGFRTHLLTFAPLGGGATLDTLLRRYRKDDGTQALEADARLFVNDPADGARYPYVVLRLTPRVGDGQHHGEREQYALEAMCVHRPRSMFWELRAIANTMQQAMHRWRGIDAGEGLVFSKDFYRESVPRPPAGSPADREVIQELLRFGIVSWPQYLTKYHAA